MKKTLLTVMALVGLSISTQAQFSAENLSIGLGANLTSYKGDVDKSTPGIQLNAVYNLSEKYSIDLGFNYGFPIKQSLSEEGINMDSKLSFKTLTLTGNYHLIGTTEDNFSLFVPVGASLVMAKAKVTATSEGEEEEDPGFAFGGSGSTSNFVINAGLGAQFKLGNPILFFKAGIALPTGSSSSNTRGESVENDNPIPFHSSIQLGLRIPLVSGY
jgi:opacity protein-like surface antigen